MNNTVPHILLSTKKKKKKMKNFIIISLNILFHFILYVFYMLSISYISSNIQLHFSLTHNHKCTIILIIIIIVIIGRYVIIPNEIMATQIFHYFHLM